MEFKAAPAKPNIALSDLEKIDIRAGTILSADEVVGYADGLTPVLAVTEKEIPNGARAG